MAKNRHRYLANSANIFTLSATKTSEIMALPRFFKHAKSKPAVPYDFTDQLDLFSEAVTDTPAPVALAPKTDERHARPRPPQQLDFGTLEPLPADDAAAVPIRRNTGEGAGGDGGTVRGSPVPPDIGREDGVHPSLGDDGGRIPVVSHSGSVGLLR